MKYIVGFIDEQLVLTDNEDGQIDVEKAYVAEVMEGPSKVD